MESEVELINVSKFFKGKSGGLKTALDNVSMKFDKGDIYGIVGESGSGKTTMARVAVGLTRINKGRVLLEGKDISTMDDHELFKIVQYIHQDPYSSLDQYLHVYEILERPLVYLLKITNREERRGIVVDMLNFVGLGDGYYNKTIQELSGGERQRVLVARAFITNPSFVVADEPTTMIDFVHRRDILELISNLSAKKNSAIMFISHDISVVGEIAQKIAVMYKGQIVERGDAKTIIDNPKHPYTQLLVNVSPEKISRSSDVFNNMQNQTYSTKRILLPMKKGCKYRESCPLAMDMCGVEEPLLKNIGDREVACFKYF